jgi:hypothetical protein
VKFKTSSSDSSERWGKRPQIKLAEFLIFVGDLWSLSLEAMHRIVVPPASSRAGRCALMDVACITLEFREKRKRNGRSIDASPYTED